MKVERGPQTKPSARGQMDATLEYYKMELNIYCNAKPTNK